MSESEFATDKINLISWITQLTDKAIFNKLKQIQKEADSAYDVPDWHQNIVAERKQTDSKEYLSEEVFKKALNEEG